MRTSAITLGLVLLAAPTLALAGPPPGPPPGETAKPSGPPPSPPPAGTTTPRPSTPPPPPTTTAPATPTEPVVEQRDPVDLSGTWTYNRGGTLAPRVVRVEDDVDVAPNPDGYYSGVSIEGNHVPPFPAPRMGTKPASLTWTGFERVGDSSRVFIEVSADVATKLDIKGAVVTVRLTNTKINVRNNARSLDLRYFRTPVRSVKVSKKGKDAVATIVMRRAVTPTLSWIAGKSGYRLLVIDFAGGSADAPAP
jgi:hypothetical protein